MIETALQKLEAREAELIARINGDHNDTWEADLEELAEVQWAMMHLRGRNNG